MLIAHYERKNYILSSMGDTVTGRIATDRKLAFPVVSSQGNNCVFILYDYGSNFILADPTKSRKCGEILIEYRKLFLHLHKRRLRTKIQRLDNELSQVLKDEMDERQVN